MKPLRTLATLLFLCCTLMAQAQTQGSKAAKSAPISDEDLEKYAITMDSIKGMQETLQQIIAEKVQQNTVMSVERYNQLFKIEKDQAKLAEAKATPEEIAFLSEISDLRELNIELINSTYQALAKEYVGIKTFNAIRKSLESDPSLKTRYEAIAKEKNAGASGGSSGSY